MEEKLDRQIESCLKPQLSLRRCHLLNSTEGMQPTRPLRLYRRSSRLCFPYGLWHHHHFSLHMLRREDSTPTGLWMVAERTGWQVRFWVKGPAAWSLMQHPEISDRKDV